MWTRRRPAGGAARLCLAVLCLVLAAACGGGKAKATKSTRFPPLPTTKFTGDPNRACGLATKPEVEAALGTPVGPGQGVGGRLCRYDLASSPSQSVLIERDETPQAAAIFDLSLSSATGAETLAGVGDRAFVAGTRAHVLRGTTLTIVTVTTSQPPGAVTAALKKLAQAVASRS